MAELGPHSMYCKHSKEAGRNRKLSQTQETDIYSTSNEKKQMINPHEQPTENCNWPTHAVGQTLSFLTGTLHKILSAERADSFFCFPQLYNTKILRSRPPRQDVLKRHRTRSATNVEVECVDCRHAENAMCCQDVVHHNERHLTPYASETYFKKDAPECSGILARESGQSCWYSRVVIQVSYGISQPPKR